ncbi:protein of unknown function DUF1080 [Pirellula staleyi DSM 6068]|uniref:3-keto-alpha-glucoside-1,2-lyase/3-keto-2-hydroxy-glucal hydratase domain-containing protein n=1 Tax=Pirellula staleyi (strain ATCC 27377 / DSM 6068 / ICPB 4128) TaxID=530564 RepID=D2R4M9_PIRSD|nr:DUF1080 domain-containing protein [Pirellula staleyi]ADB17095.1 protein of unknown function DUF1080 [Pirellula staleyi DSM 6068]
MKIRQTLLVLTALAALATSGWAAEPSVISPKLDADLSAWSFKNSKEKSQWAVGFAKLDATNEAKLAFSDSGEGAAGLVNKTGGGVDIYTNEKFGDCTISLELMVPKGSNSGIYVLGEYEVQILDSFGKAKVGPGDLGGLYGASAPLKNAAKKPGEWQTIEIVFTAPKFEGDKKIANAKFVKVTLNGEVIHENVEMKGPTPSGVTGKEAATGPLMFQGDHGAVALRNIQITPAK